MYNRYQHIGVETLLMETEKLHRGEIVKSIISRLKISKTLIADRLNIHRTTLYGYFEEPDLSLDKVVKIGAIINHDFSVEIPEVKYYKGTTLQQVNEDGANYQINLAKDYNDCVKDRDFWKTAAYESTNRLSTFKDVFYKLVLRAKQNNVKMDDILAAAEIDI